MIVKRNSVIGYFWLCGALCAVFHSLEAAKAQSILLHLRNGDRLSGTLIAEEANGLTISNSVIGKIAVPIAEIVKRELLSNATVVSHSDASNAIAVVASPEPTVSPATQKRLVDLQTAYVTGLLSPEEYHRQRSRVMAEAPVQATNSPPVVAQAAPTVVGAMTIKTAPPVKPAATKKLAGDISVGADMAFGEKDRELYSGRLKLTYTEATVRNYLDYLFTYGRNRGQLAANRMDGQMKTDVDLSPKVYFYSLAAAGYDEIRKIDWRYDLGPGIGYNLIKRPSFVARVEAGFHYQVQNFQDDRQDDTYFNRLAQDSRWNIGTQFTFDQKTEYFTRIDDFQEYKIRLEANLRYWLMSNLSLNLTVINTYDAVTAKGVGQNDVQLRSSIGVKF